MAIGKQYLAFSAHRFVILQNDKRSAKIPQVYTVLGLELGF
jgi:hypothetical protein